MNNSPSAPPLPPQFPAAPHSKVASKPRSLPTKEDRREQVDGYDGPRMWVEISQQNVIIGDAIATGTFGSIHQGKHNSKEVAIKIMNAKYVGSYDYSVFFNELSLLSSLQHENIIKLLGANTQKDTHYFMVLEYIPQGDLFKYIERNGVHMSWEDLFKIAIGIARGMESLHAQGILFRDLKSSNVLLREDLTPVICDFGMALKSDSTISIKSEATGTPLWMSPEVYMKEKFTKGADVYSFGIILTELVSGQPPFYERGDEDWEVILKEVVVRGLRPQIPGFCPDFLKEFISRCTHATVSTRPSFDKIVEELEQGRLRGGFPRREVQRKDNNDTSNNEEKLIKKRADQIDFITFALKSQQPDHTWTWKAAPFAAIGIDGQIVRAKLRNFLRNLNMFVEEDGPRLDTFTTCIVYVFLERVVESFIEKSNEKDLAEILRSTGKENWHKDTGDSITISYNRVFVALDARKIKFTTWEEQLKPLAQEVVSSYSKINQLL